MIWYEAGVDGKWIEMGLREAGAKSKGSLILLVGGRNSLTQEAVRQRILPLLKAYLPR